MAYESGREALKSENALLDQLLHMTRDFERSLPKNPGVARVVVNGWAGSFAKLKKLNEELIGESDSAFAETLAGEKQLLEKLRAAAQSSDGFAESWIELFEEDIAVADGLLKE